MADARMGAAWCPRLSPCIARTGRIARHSAALAHSGRGGLLVHGLRISVIPQRKLCCVNVRVMHYLHSHLHPGRIFTTPELLLLDGMPVWLFP